MDARVQTVTETISIIRMIKLFGWEAKSKSDIAAKREDELTWLWKRKMLDLVTKNLKYASFLPEILRWLMHAAVALFLS